MIFEAFEAAAWPFAFFNGNWWEIAVMDFLSKSGKYHDLAWSVYAGSRRDDSTDMEEAFCPLRLNAIQRSRFLDPSLGFGAFGFTGAKRAVARYSMMKA